MKNKTLRKGISERDLFIFNLWYKHNLTFKGIANYDVMGNLTRKTISNYVYTRASGTHKQRLIVRIADELKPKLGLTARVIDHIYENQPKCRLSEVHVRRIISKCLKHKQHLNISKL